MSGSSTLESKVALITGASSGIGAAIARSLAETGAKLALVGRRFEALQNSSRLCSRARAIQAYQTDLADEAQVDRLAKSVQHDFGGIDILVHSAGVFSQAKINDTTENDFDAQYQINLRAPSMLTRLLDPSLRSRQGQLVFKIGRASCRERV